MSQVSRLANFSMVALGCRGTATFCIVSRTSRILNEYTGLARDSYFLHSAVQRHQENIYFLESTDRY